MAPKATPAAAPAALAQDPPADVLDASAPTIETPAESAAEPAPEWLAWVYTGPPGRVYTHIPLTAQPGDVFAWPALPAADGAWSPAPQGAAVTRWPDNTRPDPGVPLRPAEGEDGPIGGLYEGGVTGA